MASEEGFPTPRDLKKGVFSGGGGLSDGDIEDIIRGWQARVAAANGGTLENEPFARSVVRQGARAEFQGEVLRLSGQVQGLTGAENLAEKVLTRYDEAKKPSVSTEGLGADLVSNQTNEPLWSSTEFGVETLW